ncbi:MAG: hypothetical protein NT062_09695 [Proteobacteria bacterium]|nr:hypothetical protein [Pseudomonadota bacterium]
MRTVTLALALAWSAPAFAEPSSEPSSPPAEPASDRPAPSPPSLASPIAIDELLERIAHLEARDRDHARTERAVAATHKEVQTLLPLRRFITVFVDVGAFAVAGDGSGIRSDRDHVLYPEYVDRVPGEWVFMGDPLSTAINSNGEPASTSNSRELDTDTIHGTSGLIVNAIGLSIGKDVGHGVAIASLVEVLPRPGQNLLDVELAHVDYRPSDELDLVISAGKIDSVLGIEYRSQDALRRLGVTPSLLCRYTCGRPLGLEARLVQGRLSTSASITNGDNFEQRFTPAHALRANALPTVAGHVQWVLPVGQGDGQGVELGVSGALGPQDDQPMTSIAQWHVGLDVRVRNVRRWNVSAEYVQGLQQGFTSSPTAACNVAACLRYKAAYVLVDRPVKPWFVPYVRVDWRDALHEHGVEFVYESHTLRATLGMHLEMTSRIIGKLEYTFNRELGRIPAFPNDVITTSVVVATD